MQNNAIKEPAPKQARSPFPDIKGMSFEAALKELEQIVTRLERGDVDLGPAMAASSFARHSNQSFCQPCGGTRPT